MRIYLDMCSLQRPLDSKTQTRIAVEAEAILNFIDMLESGQVELVSSQALIFEIEQITLPVRKTYIMEVLSKAGLFIPISQSIEEQARIFVDLGIKPLDSLHLASSIEAKSDYFCTCDDRFLRRAKKANTAFTKVVSPLEMIMEIG
ncbi:MAG: PIN domain-containing protein [Thermosynechococcaceae cyanobacterium]